MPTEYLVYAAGAFAVLLALFHATFWRIFRWQSQLAHLHPINRGVMQVLNFCITFLFLGMAGLCFRHAGELLGTPLGRDVLAALSTFWFFRAALQPIYFSARKPLSWAFFVLFCCGGALFGLPLAR